MSRTTAHYEDADLAMFAMQLLEGEEHQTAADHVRDCAFCRQELARLQGDLAACAYGVEMYAPALTVRERVMHQVSREKRVTAPSVAGNEVSHTPQAAQAAPVERDDEPRLALRGSSADPKQQPSPHTRRRRHGDVDEPRQKGNLAKGLFAWLGWAIAAGFAVGSVRLYQQQTDYTTRLAFQQTELAQLQSDATGAKRLLDVMTDASAQRVLLSPPEGNSGSMAEARVIYEAQKGSLILLADHLAPLGIDKIYELWLIPSDGSSPLPAGTFRPDTRGNGSVILPSLPTAVSVKAFGITVEDGAGSQTPTMPIVLAGS